METKLSTPSNGQVSEKYHESNNIQDKNNLENILSRPGKYLNSYYQTLVFYVNGKEVQDEMIDPEWTLLYYLRNKLQLTGTKLGCAEGGCGACTVMVSKFDRETKEIIHMAVNACLTPICAMHGLSVTTVEGIGSIKTQLHPIQERIAKAHGSQCGFCTPGIVMSMYALLRSIPKPTMKNLEIAFQGNLCRCTGYRPIIEGFKTFTEDWELSRSFSNIQSNGIRGNGNCAMGDACCKKAFTSEPTAIFNANEFRPYDANQEPIFPSKLQISSQWDEQYLMFKGKNVAWYRPIEFKELLFLKKKYPHAKLIVGNTEVGVEVKFKHFVYPVLIQPTQIKELCEIKETEKSMKIGASVTLAKLEDTLQYQIKHKPQYKTRIFTAIIEMLHWFAGKQIRNVAAVGGNIMTGSPISDLNPIFMAAGVQLNLSSSTNGDRTVPMDHTFFVGYRRNVVQPDEILVSIEIPFSNENQYFLAYKQAKRRDDDIAIVNMALNVCFKNKTNKIQNIDIAFGGMAPTTILAKKTSEKLRDREWNKDLLDVTHNSLIEELPLSDDAPGGMVKYRRSLTLSLFFKAFIQITKDLQFNSIKVEPLMEELKSASENFHYEVPKSSQYYQVVPKNQNQNDLIGRPIVHTSAYKQASGEAIYCDDMPKIVGELYLALVLSTKAHAKILKIDPSKALEHEGVVAFFSAKDIREDRKWVGAIFHDEEVFVSEKVTSQGQSIGAIVAIDQATAQKAAKMVYVEYEDLQPIIVSIEDAIAHESYFPGYPTVMVDGDVEKGFSESDHILEGEVRMGGQEHFYLETQASIVIPREDELEIFCSTQHPMEIQKLVAYILDMHISKINVRVKRIGGGFGGKESRGTLVALPVALAAKRLQKPVRCMLDRDEDMAITGGRHPFYFRYKVGFKKNGLIKAIEISIYINAGYSHDLSTAVLGRAMFHYENSYKVPACKVTGYVCQTNLPSNTAFRGFGGPQGMFAAEVIIRHMADYLNVDVVKISEMNLYKEGDVTHYNQKLEHCSLDRCWKECISSSDYAKRIEIVQQYNKMNRYKKKGIAVVPTKFGISFTALYMNQSAALIHVYTDGSVLLHHGGVEMGQGLHTKMIQVASRTLKVKPEKINVMETATDKIPNTSPTAASAGSDLNGMAVMYACNEIMEKLKPIMDQNPKGTWEEWVNKAYFERISLTGYGFYKTPDIGYDPKTNSGNAFNYFTYGVACTEVEIDCLTGDHRVLRSDIVMDLGNSLNPAIDIGQVEGGFIQGYGLFTLEELIYSSTGTLYSKGPGAYKLPGFTDIPNEFNVFLLKGAANPRAIYSSKAVGEPPLFLASSVFFAIKEAIKAARKDMNLHGYFGLVAPATSARIRMACADEFTTKIPDPDVKKQWNKVP